VAGAELLTTLHRAIGERRKLRFAYVAAGGEDSERTVRPLGVTLRGQTWTLLAWCELRDDFRSFRPDRMRALTTLRETFVEEPGKDLATFLERALDARGH